MIEKEVALAGAFTRIFHRALFIKGDDEEKEKHILSSSMYPRRDRQLLRGIAKVLADN